jgi:hypothetical protein
LHYIAVTAQGAPGKDISTVMRMPFKQIGHLVISWAKPINALVFFLDIQVGHSTVKEEVTELENTEAMPNAIFRHFDPEFL